MQEFNVFFRVPPLKLYCTVCSMHLALMQIQVRSKSEFRTRVFKCSYNFFIASYTRLSRVLIGSLEKTSDSCSSFPSTSILNFDIFFTCKKTEVTEGQRGRLH